MANEHDLYSQNYYCRLQEDVFVLAGRSAEDNAYDALQIVYRFLMHRAFSADVGPVRMRAKGPVP